MSSPDARDPLGPFQHLDEVGRTGILDGERERKAQYTDSGLHVGRDKGWSVLRFVRGQNQEGRREVWRMKQRFQDLLGWVCGSQ